MQKTEVEACQHNVILTQHPEFQQFLFVCEPTLIDLLYPCGDFCAYFRPVAHQV